MQIFGFLGSWLGYILWGIFYLFKNFSVSIILFTVLVRLLMFPFTIKQQKTMAKTSKLSKKQKEIQEKYANNREKMQEEMNKLYEKENVKPGGGCLTMIVPLIVLLGVFYAVSYPLSNTLHLDSDSINSAIAYVDTIPGYASSIGSTYQEISFLRIFPNIMNTEAIQGIFSSSDISTIEMFYNGFNTFGVDLLSVPREYGLLSPMILFPVLCFLSNVLSQVITTKLNGNQAAQQQQGCMKAMIYILPLFSAYIAYTVPAAVGFYWIVSALISLVQSIFISKIYSPTQITAKSEAQHIALMYENEAKVPYVYAPHELKSAKNSKSKNTGKKKK
ncbi:MAG: YidC/Oxa1 family membrane protein insertase [Clostridiales bacterium]|nr:YidC/Oxa1 family membrane protein insertase [Clostridiales bacterium]